MLYGFPCTLDGCREFLHLVQINEDVYPQHDPSSWLADSSRKSSAGRVNARHPYKRDTGGGHSLKETNEALLYLPALWRFLLTG